MKAMLISGDTGDGAVRLCYETVAGEFSAQYAVDEATQRRTDVEPDADVGDGEITVRFPDNIVGVAVEWPVWKAVLTVDGADVDSQLAQVT